MADSVPIAPEELLATMLAAARHPRKRRNLEALHKLCQERFDAKSTEWSYTSIGRLMESNDLLTIQSLQQRQSDDYRALIDAWRMKAQAAFTHKDSKLTKSEKRWYENIDDLWARQMAAALDQEVQELRKKNALLEKWKGTVTVRIDGTPTSPTSTTTVVPSAGVLTVQEKRALLASISAPALSRIQLTLGPQGELRNDGGVIFFQAGWATGIRKLLRLVGE